MASRRSSGCDGSLNERALDIADVVFAVANESGHSAAQVALAWTLRNAGVAATLIGARRQEQLEDNLGALSVELSDEQWKRLELASAISLGFPHHMLRSPMVLQVMTGGAPLPVRTW
ncbi:aldo/keto reductase [Lysobacter sp. P5_B9]